MDTIRIFQCWEENLALQSKVKIKETIESSLLFFFKFEKDIYGCPEESRLVFAKLKVPDEDVTPSWDTDASFLALNLSRGLTENEIPKRLFYKKDIKNLKIITKEDALKELDV